MKTTLSAKQAEAIKALIICPTLKEAAEASGTPIRTLERWLTQPMFKDALNHVQHDCFKDTGKEIISSMPVAHEAIIDVLRNPTQLGANMKLKAAHVILEQGGKYHKSLDQDERIKKLEEKAGIEDASRIAKIEDYFCKKIVDNYMRSDEYDPIAPLNRIELEILEGMVQHDPGKINLLTPVERVKYDNAYADKIKLNHLQEKQKEIFRAELEEAENEQQRKKGRRKEQEPVKQPFPSNGSANELNAQSPVDLAPNVNVEPQSGLMAICQSILTDEDIMKWDPDNFDTIKRIMAENEQQSQLEDDEETDL